MQIRWYGQSAFSLTDGGRTVFIDPFGDMSASAARGIHFDYPPIEGVEADLLLITHEHRDHNGADAIGGTPPNTIFVFTLGGDRIGHFGDFGQAALRPEQRAAIGHVDILFLPIGGQATIGAEAAAEIVRELAPRLVVPMHYRTELIDFLEPPDAFVEAVGATRVDSSELVAEDHEGVVLLAPPR